MSQNEQQRLADAVERLLHGMLGGSPNCDPATLCDLVYQSIAEMTIANKKPFLEELRETVEGHLP